LERRAGAIRFRLVVTRNDPHLAAMLDAHLRRAEDVARRVQRDAHAVQVYRFSILREANRRADTEPSTQDPLAGPGREIRVATPARVVAMRMGDDGAWDGQPGIDVEVAGLAVKAMVGDAQEHAWNLRRVTQG